MTMTTDRRLSLRRRPDRTDPRPAGVIRYGTIAGWPVDLHWWRTPPPETVRAVRLEPGLWVRLTITDVGIIAPPESPQLQDRSGDADYSRTDARPRLAVVT